MKERVVFLLLSCVILVAAAKQPYPQKAVDGSLIRTVEEAREAGCVVSENGDVTSGQEIWAEFYGAAKARKPAAVWLADWYEDGLDGKPVLYVQELVFDGKAYTVRGGERDETYQHLLCFLNEPSYSQTSTYKTATRYVLTDDAELTWPEIFNGWVSSISGNSVRSREVYTDYIWREEAAN